MNNSNLSSPIVPIDYDELSNYSDRLPEGGHYFSVFYGFHGKSPTRELRIPLTTQHTGTVGTLWAATACSKVHRTRHYRPYCNGVFVDWDRPLSPDDRIQFLRSNDVPSSPEWRESHPTRIYYRFGNQQEKFPLVLTCEESHRTVKYVFLLRKCPSVIERYNPLVAYKPAGWTRILNEEDFVWFSPK